MIKLLKYIKGKYWVYIGLIVIFVTAQVFCDLAMPDYLKQIMTEASNTLMPGVTDALKNEAIRNIWINGGIMLGICVASLVCVIIVAYLASKVAAEFSYQLRHQMYKKVEEFSMSEIDKFSTSSLLTRTTNDITQVQMVTVMVLRMALAAPVFSIYGIVKAVSIQGAAELSNIVIFSIVALVLLVVVVFLIVLPKFNKIQALTDRLNLVARENLTGLRVVRANNAQELEENKFNEANTNITKNNIFVNRTLSLFQPGISMLLNFTSLAILWIGASLTFDNPSLLPSVFTFQQYTMMIVMGFMSLTMIMIMIPRGVVSARRINEVLNTEVIIKDHTETKQNTDVKGSIEFKNVTFSYNDGEEPVLDNISFSISGGQTLAIIGGTGSGKSTLINLIPRFFDVNSGEVLVDGINVKDYSQSDLRDRIGFVPQKANLFKGTIRSNLAFGKDNPTDEEIKEALDIASSSEFVDKIGYDASVSQGGTNFSGGQKQRLCIARAIIKKPEILVFDDSFSALDLKTDKAIREALKAHTKDTTNVIVAQRISTIMSADKIIVLDDGKIVGYGTHKELLQSCEVYQEIANSQMSKEELENA